MLSRDARTTVERLLLRSLRVVAWFYVFWALSFWIGLTGYFQLSSNPKHFETHEWLVMIALTIVPVLWVPLSNALQRRAPWARNAALALAAVSFLEPPVGVLIGAIAITYFALTVRGVSSDA